jgi:phosphoglycerate dehydrogenase-like enzyme
VTALTPVPAPGDGRGRPLTGLYCMDPARFATVYGEQERHRLAGLVQVDVPPVSAADLRDRLDLLAGVDVLLTGWGGPVLDAALLAAAPRLRLVLYAAGSIRKVVTEEFWDRGIPIVSAYAMNAVPVVEFTVAQIVYALKHGWRYVLQARAQRRAVPRRPEPGGYGSVVGVLSLGTIGRGVCERLAGYDVRVQAHDPFADAELTARLGVKLVGLEELFATSDVVTVHTPLLPETRGLVGSPLLAAMKEGATLINTARGAVLDEPALIRVLERRPDLFAVLDVTDPEPPADSSPLFTLPNVVVTPHIAGSLGPECRRMAALVADELERFVAGLPLRWAVSREQAERMA